MAQACSAESALWMTATLDARPLACCALTVHACNLLSLQVLDALPDLSPYELRLGHSQLFAAAVAGLGLPPEVSPSSVMALLASAIKVSASQPASDAANGTHAGAASAGTHTAGSSSSSSSGPHSHTAAAGHAGSAASGGSSSAGAGAGGSSSSGRANVWPAVRVGLDGLGLDSKPVSRCRHCVLKLPGG
jgi:hypothetical protein